LKFIGYRERSSSEIRQNLRKKGLMTVIEKVLAR
jgi:SOS response regulatory protein OraA/RecX